MDERTLQQIDESLHGCIEACERCITACENCANQALDEGGLYALVRAARDCADLCAVTVRFLVRHAELSPELCEVCAKACEVCREECEKFEAPFTATCAAACRTCHAECVDLAA